MQEQQQGWKLQEQHHQQEQQWQEEQQVWEQEPPHDEEASDEDCKANEFLTASDANPSGERAIPGAGRLGFHSSSSSSSDSSSSSNDSSSSSSSNDNSSSNRRSDISSIWAQWQKRAKGRRAIAEAAAAAEEQSERSWDWRTQMTQLLESIRTPFREPQEVPTWHGCFATAAE